LLITDIELTVNLINFLISGSTSFIRTSGALEPTKAVLQNLELNSDIYWVIKTIYTQTDRCTSTWPYEHAR